MDRFVHAALYALIAVCAWTYSRWNEAHRTIALLCAAFITADMARLALDPTLDAARTPYGPGMLALYYLDHALVLSFRFAVLAACLSRFARRSISPALVAFVPTLLALIVYKQATGASLLPAHHLIAALTTAVCWVLVSGAMFAPASRLQMPDGTHAALMLIVMLMLVKVLLHYADPLDDSWMEVRQADTLVYGIIATSYLYVLLRRGIRAWQTSQS